MMRGVLAAVLALTAGCVAPVGQGAQGAGQVCHCFDSEGPADNKPDAACGGTLVCEPPAPTCCEVAGYELYCGADVSLYADGGCSVGSLQGSNPVAVCQGDDGGYLLTGPGVGCVGPDGGAFGAPYVFTAVGP